MLLYCSLKTLTFKRYNVPQTEILVHPHYAIFTCTAENNDHDHSDLSLFFVIFFFRILVRRIVKFKRSGTRGKENMCISFFTHAHARISLAQFNWKELNQKASKCATLLSTETQSSKNMREWPAYKICLQLTSIWRRSLSIRARKWSHPSIRLLVWRWN
jgi:hypothetical protein